MKKGGRKVINDVEYKSTQLIWDKNVFNTVAEHDLETAKQWCIAAILHDARQDGIVLTSMEDIRKNTKYIIEKPKEYPDMIRIRASVKLSMYI